jgi:ribosomal protein S7
MSTNLAIQNKLINYVMQDGKKHTSEKQMIKSYKLIQKNQKKNFKEIFKFAVVNSSPFFYIKQIQRKKKPPLEFPFLLKTSLKIHYGIKSIINSSTLKKSLPFYKKYSLEIINSSKLLSEGVKKKKEIYKNAFFTKRYANYRWF